MYIFPYAIWKAKLLNNNNAIQYKIRKMCFHEELVNMLHKTEQMYFLKCKDECE